MDKLITFEHDDKELECIIEYVDIKEDGNVFQEVINVFLPEEYTRLDKRELGLLKVKASEEFHNQY